MAQSANAMACCCSGKLCGREGGRRARAGTVLVLQRSLGVLKGGLGQEGRREGGESCGSEREANPDGASKAV